MGYVSPDCWRWCLCYGGICRDMSVPCGDVMLCKFSDRCVVAHICIHMRLSLLPTLPYIMPKVSFAGVRHRVPVARIYQVSTFHKGALQQATAARYCEVGDSSSWKINPYFRLNLIVGGLISQAHSQCAFKLRKLAFPVANFSFSGYLGVTYYE